MAEVLGTVVGVISLGIQVSSAIGAYIEGVQCRKEEVESIVRYQRSFQVLLAQIDSLKDRLLRSSIPNTTALEEALKTANAQIVQLDAFLGKVLVPENFASLKSVRQMCRDGKIKLLYPFRRDRLDDLERELETTNIALQSAMEVMELYGTYDQSLPSLLTMAREISMTVQTSVYQMQKETSTANVLLLDIKKSIDCGTSHSQSNDLLTKRDIDELKSVVEALTSTSSDAMSTLQRLVSKPDALRVICDGMTNEQTGHSMPRLDRKFDVKVDDEGARLCSSLYCNCGIRRSLKRETQRAGPAFLVKEVVIERPHLPLCPLSDYVHEQSKWSAGISARLLQGIVSVALTFTTSTTFGAGGFAISPYFTYLPIRDTSPAQQAILLLNRALDQRVWSDQHAEGLERRTIKAIQISFNSRTSSPFDIGSTGNTLLHDALLARHKKDRKLRTDIVKYLTSAGVPRDRPDRRGIYPFQAAFGSAFYYPWPTRETVDMLCPDDGVLAIDIQQARSSLKDWYIVAEHTEIMRKCSKLAQLYIGHPSEAIVSRNALALRHALDRNVSLSDLATYDAFGNTSLNHLLDWPEGFKLVLHRFGTKMFHVTGETLMLQYALIRGGNIYSSERSTNC